MEAAGITTLEKLRSKILRDILSVAGAGEGVVDEVVTILSKRCLLPRPKSLGELLVLLASSARAREALEQRSYLGAASNPRPLLLPLPLCLLLVRCLFGDGEASKSRPGDAKAAGMVEFFHSLRGISLRWMRLASPRGIMAVHKGCLTVSVRRGERR